MPRCTSLAYKSLKLVPFNIFGKLVRARHHLSIECGELRIDTILGDHRQKRITRVDLPAVLHFVLWSFFWAKCAACQTRWPEGPLMTDLQTLTQWADAFHSYLCSLWIVLIDAFLEIAALQGKTTNFSVNNLIESQTRKIIEVHLLWKLSCQVAVPVCEEFCPCHGWWTFPALGTRYCWVDRGVTVIGIGQHIGEKDWDKMNRNDINRW